MRERIQYLIEYLGLNQKSFAESIGLRASTITDYLKGRSKELSSSSIIKIKEKHNVNPLWLLTGEREIFLPDKKADNMSGLVFDELSTYLHTDESLDANTHEVVEGNVETYPDITTIEQIYRTAWFQNLSSDKKWIIAALDEIDDAEYIRKLRGWLEFEIDMMHQKKEIDAEREKRYLQKGEAG